MSKSLLTGLLAVALLALVASAVMAQGWGDLQGQFVYGGKPPKPGKIAKTNADCDAFEDLIDESLLVDAKGGLANVVIWLEPGTSKLGDVHKSYSLALAAPVKLDNGNCRFQPHIAVAHTGQPIALGNLDKFGHNVNFVGLKNSFNDLVPSSRTITKTVKDPEKLPMPVSCGIHTFMKGYLVVKDHPYVTVTAPDGTFIIRNIPTGKWTFRAWHERSGFLKEVTINKTTEDWSKGFTSTITANGVTKLGTMVVAPEKLDKK